MLLSYNVALWVSNWFCKINYFHNWTLKRRLQGGGRFKVLTDAEPFWKENSVLSPPVLDPVYAPGTLLTNIENDISDFVCIIIKIGLFLACLIYRNPHVNCFNYVENPFPKTNILDIVALILLFKISIFCAIYLSQASYRFNLLLLKGQRDVLWYQSIGNVP